MPLVIAVLIIIVIFCVGSDSRKDAARRDANFSTYSVKTNASLECWFFEEGLLQGLEPEAAYAKSQKDIIDKGFTPCIKFAKYFHDKIHTTGNIDTNMHPEQYDSDIVKSRREEYKRLNPGASVYDNFPQSTLEYERDCYRLTKMMKFKSVGSSFTHMKYGYCTIIGVNINTGTYEVKTSTGETKLVPANSSDIVQMK